MLENSTVDAAVDTANDANGLEPEPGTKMKGFDFMKVLLTGPKRFLPKSHDATQKW